MKMVRSEVTIRELANGKIVDEIAGKEVTIEKKNDQFICASKGGSCVSEDK